MHKKNFILLLVAILSLSGCAYDIENSSPTNNLVSTITTSNLDINLENSEPLNREAVILGTMCSAHKYKVNLGKDLENSLTALDKDGTLNNTPNSSVQLIGSASNSTVKCIFASAMLGKCLANVNVSGKIISKNGSSKPFNISKKSTMSSATCAGARNSLKAASVEAITDIVNMVKKHDQ